MDEVYVNVDKKNIKFTTEHAKSWSQTDDIVNKDFLVEQVSESCLLLRWRATFKNPVDIFASKHYSWGKSTAALMKYVRNKNV